MKKGDRVLVRRDVTAPMFWRPYYGARWRRVYWPLINVRGTVEGVSTWKAWQASNIAITVKLDRPLPDGRRWLCFGRRELVPLTATQPIPRKGEPWTTTLTLPISLQDRASHHLERAKDLARRLAVPSPTPRRQELFPSPVTRPRLR